MSKTNSLTTKGWEELSDWYAGWAGKKGSYYHQNLVFPLLKQQLKHTIGKSVLDVGCGTASAAGLLQSLGLKYTGIDASPKMIKYARQYFPQARLDVSNVVTCEHKFLQGKYDFVLSIFSMQDIADLEAAIKCMVQSLHDDGELLIFMKHPAFTIPRQTGWSYDEKRKLHSLRIDGYLKPKDIPLKPLKGRAVVRSHHRPLSVYLNTFIKHGLQLQYMEELPDPKAKNQDIARFVFLRLGSSKLAYCF